jgi:hypothetical protein
MLCMQLCKALSEAKARNRLQHAAFFCDILQPNYS